MSLYLPILHIDAVLVCFVYCILHYNVVLLVYLQGAANLTVMLSVLKLLYLLRAIFFTCDSEDKHVNASIKHNATVLQYT